MALLFTEEAVRSGVTLHKAHSGRITTKEKGCKLENSIDQNEGETNSFTEMWTGNLQGNIECHIYLARAQGFRAGVRPHTAPPIPGDEDNPPLTRDVFVEFPERTVEWFFTDAVADWLDSLPQYDH